MSGRAWARVLPLALLLAGCEAPGEGREAALGFRRATPLVAALGAYRADHGRYPAALQDLVGSYVPAAALAGPEEDLAFEYRRTGQTYELRFEYFGPGSNWCTFTPGATGWECGGLY